MSFLKPVTARTPFDLGKLHGSTRRHAYAPPTSYTSQEKVDYARGFDVGVDTLSTVPKTRKARVHPMVAFTLAG